MKKELIADKIKRIAATPQVVRNIRMLKAMRYITKREDALLHFKNTEVNINRGTKQVTAVVSTFKVNDNHLFYDDLVTAKLVMFPLEAYDTRTGHPPTISAVSALALGIP